MRKYESLLGLVAAAALVLLMLFLPRLAQAQDVLVSTNDAGGEIVLTGRQCTLRNTRYAPLREAYAVHPTGRMIEGCWAVIDDSIHVVWMLPGREERRVYPAGGFTVRRVGGGV